MELWLLYSREDEVPIKHSKMHPSVWRAQTLLGTLKSQGQAVRCGLDGILTFPHTRFVEQEWT